MAKILYGILIIFGVIRNINSKYINYETYCPSGYNHVPNTKICVYISKTSSAYENKCLNTGQTDPYFYANLFHRRNSEQLIAYLRKIQGINSVWLPIRKNVQKFLVWKLPLPTWNMRMSEINSTNAPTNYERGDCVLYLVDKNGLVMENCGTLHHHLCIVSQTSKYYAITSLCGELTVTSRLSDLHGFCFEMDHLNASVRTSPKKTIAFIGSIDKLVAVDQFISYDGHKNDKVQIATDFYHKYPPDYVSALENSSIVFMDKRLVLYRVVEQNIVERIHNYRVTIQIMHDTDHNILIVNIRNYRFLWTIDFQDYAPIKCYTDANLKTDILSEVTSNQTKIGPNFHITIKLPLHIGIGNYWCEGQKLSTFKSIVSNRLTVIHKKNQMETYILCAYAEKNCAGCNFYGTVENCKEFQPMNGVNNTLQDVQLKKILSIQDNTISVLLHVHIGNPSKRLDQANNLKFFREIIQNALTEYKISEIRAIDTCFSQNLDYFPNARLNEISVFKQFCLMDTGLPVIQKCIGNQFDGAYWERVYNITTILENCESSLMNERPGELFVLNQKLRALNETNVHDDKAKSIIENTISSVNRIVTMVSEEPTEVQYAAITLNHLFENSRIDVFSVIHDGNISTILDPVVKIIDKLLERETHPLIEDPNRILGTIDALAIKYAESELTNKVFLGSNDGVILIQKPNIILMIVNPTIKNISGIALYKNTKFPTNLNDFNVRKLQGHENAVNIYNKSLELAAQIPDKWLAKIQIDQNGEMMPPKRIIFKIFDKHSLFDETQVDRESGVITETVDTDSKIVSISVSNYTGFEATHGLFAMFRTKLHLRRSKPLYSGCSDFSADADTNERRWNRYFSKFENLDDSIVVCPMKRLSNIGFVKLFGNKVVTDRKTRILIAVSRYTTISGCVLSVFGLVLIFLTAKLFEKWKLREATPLVLNISIAIFLQIIMFVVAESQIFTSSVNCLIVGGILHYITLVVHFISLFVANCQYRRYILIFGPATTNYFKVKIGLIGWLVPLLIVASCILMEPNSYRASEEFQDLGGVCYPTNMILLCFVHFPIVTIFGINSAVYLWIIFHLAREDPGLRKTPRKSIIVAQLRLFLLIFTILSLTWIFGLLAHYTELYAFSFLFNLFASMQGFCLFVFCCLGDAQTRKFWFKCKVCKK